MRILVVDDEPDVVEIITVAFRLHRPSYEIIPAYDGKSALARLESDKPNLVVLDVAMPIMDGFEVSRRIRLDSDVPIILLTARTTEADKVRGLELGADDYITKPFGHRELLARVDAVLRRAHHISIPKTSAVFHTGDLAIDFVRREVSVEGQPVVLTPTEYNLLAQLAKNADNVVTHQSILSTVWGHDYRDEIHYLKVYLGRLREKLERDPSNPQYIVSVRGVGYKLAM